MKNTLFASMALTIMLGVSFASESYAGTAEEITLKELISRVVNNYPSLDIAAIQIQRARQEFAKVESQLGWVLSAHGGYSRDVSFIDSPTDRYEAGVNLGKKLESGSSLELAGLYARDDSQTSFSPALPNPADRTRLDLKYRIPLAKGEDNPGYSTALINANSGLAIQSSSQRLLIDNLIKQATLLYYDALLVSIRIDDAQSSINRTNRLLSYVNKNRKLGLAEKKDILRVKTQLTRHIAQRDSLQAIWLQQRSELNRLTGKPVAYEFVPVIEPPVNMKFDDAALLENIYNINPDLDIQKGQLQLAQAAITQAQDAKRDQLDLVLSVGSRTSSGDTSLGNTSNEEVVGGAQLEYRYDIDQRGFSASLYQTLLQKEQANTEIARIKTEIQYQLYGLLAQLKANKKAVDSSLAHLELEKAKMADAYERYKEGRATTNELIEFEDSLQVSHLSHQNQKVVLSRNIASLALLAGELWDQRELDKRVGNVFVGDGLR